MFGSLPENILAWIDKKDSAGMDKWADEMLKQMIPSAIPTALLPAIEWTTNWSFFRERPVVPASEKDKPPEQQFGPWTTETAKSIGEALKVSPRKLENALGSWFGGMSRYMLDGMDLALTKLDIREGPPKPELLWWEQTPGLRTFFTRAYRTNSASIRELYDEYREVKHVVERAEGRDKKGVADWKDRRRLYNLQLGIAQLAKIRKIVRRIQAAANKTPETKRREIEFHAKRMIAVARQALGKEK